MGSGSERLRNETWLREQYADRRRSMRDIADECDVSKTTVLWWVKRHGIEREDRHRDADWLRARYHEDYMTLQEMADEADVAYATILRWMNHHGIERRNDGRRPNGMAHAAATRKLTIAEADDSDD